MLVGLFFTYEYSLKTWHESGTLNKELEIYKMLNEKYGVRFKFITYGDKNEIDYVKGYDFISVIPVFTYFKKSKIKIINIIKSIFIPFLIKDQLDDVSILKQHQLLGSWTAIISKYINNKPLIIRTGYDMFLFSKKENKNLLKRFLYYLLTLVSVKLSDLYTMSSESDAQHLKKYFKIKNLKIRKNWVNEINLIKRFEERYQNKIIAVGRLEEQKNYKYIIDSLVGSNFSLDIVGKGSMEKSLRTYAIKNNVNLNYLGIFENEKLMDIYQNYKYFVLASHYEGNPKVILEAMSSGCICFVSNIENNKEIVIDKQNGFILNESTNSLIDNIKKLEADNVLKDEIINNGKKFLEDNYLLSDLVDKEFSDYKSLVKKN